jgi:hypothetical protein
MVTKEELCQKIQDVYPKAGVCGVDFEVEYDETAQAWAVDLHQGFHHLRTFIETDEANQCLSGKMCIPLGLQVAQLKHNFDRPACDD